MVFEELTGNPQETKPQSAERSGKPLSLLSMSEHPALSKSAELLASDENALLRNVKNLASVYSDLLPAIPGAIVEQIKSDCRENTGATLLKVSEAAALGLGTAVLLARSPVLAKTLITGTGIAGSALMLKETAGFTGQAAGANSAEEQASLAAAGKASIGRLGANLIETSPGLFLGAGGGYMLASRVQALDTIALSLRNLGELKARQLVPEGFHYLSFDARTMSGLGAEGELNLLKASRQWLEQTPWRGVEEGRFFKTAGADTIKASARIPGTETEVVMGRRSQQMFHTHESRLLPTSGDFNSVIGTGVIGLPKEGILAFYEGTGTEARNILSFLKAGKAEDAAQVAQLLHEKTFSTVVVDPSRGLSLRVDSRWNAGMNRLEPSSVRPLDYKDTVNNLSKWNGRLNIESIQSSGEALLKPGMTDLLRKLDPKNGI